MILAKEALFVYREMLVLGESHYGNKDESGGEPFHNLIGVFHRKVVRRND